MLGYSGCGEWFAPRNTWLLVRFTCNLKQKAATKRTAATMAKERSVSFQREWHARFTWSKSCDLWSPNPHLHLDSFHTVDCVRWVTVRSHIQYHTFCWPSGCTTRMKNQKQTLFVLIREPLSRTPSKSMLPYCTRSMFTTAQTGTVRTNPPGPSGSHLISGATKLSLQPLGLTYSQSEYQKRFDRLPKPLIQFRQRNQWNEQYYYY